MAIEMKLMDNLKIMEELNIKNHPQIETGVRLYQKGFILCYTLSNARKVGE